MCGVSISLEQRAIDRDDATTDGFRQALVVRDWESASMPHAPAVSVLSTIPIQNTITRNLTHFTGRTSGKEFPVWRCVMTRRTRRTHKCKEEFSIRMIAAPSVSVPQRVLCAIQAPRKPAERE